MRELIYLSSMLHDLGEFGKMATPNMNKEGHEEVSFSLIENIGALDSMLDDMKDLVLNHHNPTTIYEKIIRAADILSCKEEKYEELLNHENEPKLLKPVFEKIKERDNGIRGDYVYKVKPLELSNIFPVERKEIENIQAAYDELYQNFCEELKIISNPEQLLYLLEKYLWCIPSQDQDRNHDISMYEHSRNAAAIGLCLYDQYLAGLLDEKMIDNIERDSSEQFLLINGDISGIQDFIMSVTSKNATKSLKSHSIYLSVLTDVIVGYILDKLRLKDANLLYSGGGSFFILAPKASEGRLKEIKNNIMMKILKAHDGDIFYAIDYIALTPQDFIDFPNQWQRVVDKVNKQKRLKWDQIETGLKYDLLFGPFDKGTTENGHCNLCGTSYEWRNKRQLSYEEEEINICSLCHSFIELTEELREAKYYCISKCEEISLDRPRDYRDIFRSFGYDVCFLKERKNKAKNYLLNNTDFLQDNSYGFKFGAYSLPKRGNRWLTFEELAKQSEGDKKLLGILKLDVDNLGSIFAFGLESNRTVSRITSLSRKLSLYFEGYINQIIKDMDMEEDIYVVYSGGDDTFLIGGWDKVLTLAGEFRRKFDVLVCGNEKITFSAGIGIFAFNYPVIRSIDITESYLDEAKNYKYEEEELASKNKVSLLGEIFNWEEFNRIEKVKQILVDTINKAKEMNQPNVGRALLYKIQKSTAGFKWILNDSNKGKVDSLRFWKLAYYLREVKEMDDKGRYGRKFAEEIIEEYREIVLHNLTGKARENNIRNIMIIPVATRLAEMLTRQEEGK